MQIKSLVKKIFDLAWYDFTQNFTQWFNLASKLAASVTLVILPLLIMHCQIGVWSYPTSLLTSVDALLYEWFMIVMHWCATSPYSIMGNVVWYCMQFVYHCFFAGLTMVLLQNSLDLAFDSTMSGFGSMNNWLYIRIMAIMACMTLLSSQCLRYFQTTSELLQHPLVVIFGSIIIFYWSQLWYLQIMHAMEYKKEYWQTYADMLLVARHHAKVLGKIFFGQMIVFVGAVIGIHKSWTVAARVLTRIMIWPLQMVLQNLPNFGFKSSLLYNCQILLMNFWYALAYFLLASWIFLVWAHLYRRLICPPVDNPSCESCNSCSK